MRICAAFSSEVWYSLIQLRRVTLEIIACSHLCKRVGTGRERKGSRMEGEEGAMMEGEKGGG